MTENLRDDGWTVLQVPVPPELVAIGCAPDLQRFFDAMIYKLRRNAHKGKWEELSQADAEADLHAEVGELTRAIRAGSTAEIWMEAADVANEALITAAIALEAKGAGTGSQSEKIGPPVVDGPECPERELTDRYATPRPATTYIAPVSQRTSGL